jgi:hypothetical protein
MNYNKHFLIVFTPNDKLLYSLKRFLVSANQLYKYIGLFNSYKALQTAFLSPLGKTTLKYRKHGKLEFYSK